MSKEAESKTQDQCDMSVSSNSKSHHYHDNQKIEEINNKLGSYINLIKNDISQRNNSNKTLLEKHLECSSGLSMKNLYKDLTTLKLLYDEELRMMRSEIEELSAVKNKYSLENFNLEVKLQDFFEKFEELKKANQNLVDELNEEKLKSNRLEFEMESLKIETEKPCRENKQLRKDLEDILSKINEKQAITNYEITYRQDLERKYKELSEATVFEKKLLVQEVENTKSLLNAANETIKQLETNLSQALKNQEEIVDQKSKKILDYEDANKHLRFENKKLREKNESLKNFAEDLEKIITNMEFSRKNEKQNNFNTDLDWNHQSTKPSTKHKSHIEDVRLQMKSPVQRSCDSQNDQSILDSSIKTVSSKFDNEKCINESNENYNENKHVPSKVYKRPSSASIKTLNDIYNVKTLNDCNFNSSTTCNKTNSSTLATPSLLYHSESATPMSNHQNKSRVTSTCSVRSNVSNEIKLKKAASDVNKDYTAEMFNNFERKTFSKDKSEVQTVKSNNSEASYIGNIKIHDIQKDGSYVRVLNTSNTIEEDLGTYTLQQMISAMPVAVFRFPKSVKLAPGRIITVWCNNDAVEQQPPHTFVWKQQSKWSTGPECTTVLAKPNGQAVSWTTGSHKYGNVDTDEFLSVYSPKRVQTASCQINRKKLVAIFSPTKHPYGQSNSKTESLRRAESQKVSFDVPQDKSVYKNIFNQSYSIPQNKNQLNRPIQSATGFRPKTAKNDEQRSRTTMNSRKLETTDSDTESDEHAEEIYQENVKYFNQ